MHVVLHRGRRLTEIKALHEVDSHRLQPLNRLKCLNPFGDNLETKLIRKLRQLADHGPVHGIGNARNERYIELDIVWLQIADHLQRISSCSHIVQGEAEPFLAIVIANFP